MKKLDYSSLFTLRKDGRYMGYWHEVDEDGNRTGPRHAIYDRDPERLYRRIQERENTETAPVTFRQCAERWENEYRETVSIRTWNNFKPHYVGMKESWGKLPIGKITAEMINADLLRAKAQGLSRTVVNSRKVIITGILNSALAHGDIPYNPALSVKLPKGLKAGKRSAPSEEIVQIICDNIDHPFGFFPFTLLCTGLRKSEALALHKSDVDLKAKPQHKIDILRSLTYISNANPTEKLPKNNKTRWVPILDVYEEPLKQHMASVRGDLLFPRPASHLNEGGGYYSEKAYEVAWDNYCRDVGLIDENGKHLLTAHVMRHATETMLFEADVDVYTASQILGHSDVSITIRIYAELREKKKIKSVKKFDRSVSKMLSKSVKAAI